MWIGYGNNWYLFISSIKVKARVSTLLQMLEVQVRRSNEFKTLITDIFYKSFSYLLFTNIIKEAIEKLQMPHFYNCFSL